MKRAAAAFLRLVARTHETRWIFAIGGAVLYTAFLAYMHAYHEFWRDEIHSWAVARTADGFWDLVVGDRVYDGHPPLWYWYLRAWSFIIRDANGMHVANVAAMGTAALLLLRYGPFPRFLKLLMLFSYLLGFEYGVMTRNYTLDWLVIVCFCALYRPMKPRLLGLALVLGLLCISSAYGALCACALALTMIPIGASLSIPRPMARGIQLVASPRLVGAGVLLAGSMAFAVQTTVPPEPNPFSPGWNIAGWSIDGFIGGLRTIFLSVLPVRRFDDHEYWYRIDTYWSEHLTISMTIGCVVLVAIMLVVLVPRWWLVVSMAVGIFLMLSFQMVRYGGSVRHWGHHYMLFVALCWLARALKPRGRHIAQTLVLLGIAAFQTPSLAAAAYRDRLDVFAGGKPTADFIRRAGLQDLPLVGGPEYFSLSVSSYLDRMNFSSESEEVTQTAVFHSRRHGFSPEGLVARAVEVARQKHTPVLVVSNGPIGGTLPPGARLQHLYHYEGPMCINDERFWVYELFL